MRQPFNAIQAEILEAISEALFYGVEMVISPAQVVENLQHQFGLISGTKPEQIGLLIDAVFIVLGGPFFLIRSPAGRAQVIRDRLELTTIDFLQDLARIRTIIYAGYYGHWQGDTQDDNVDNPVHAQIGFTLPRFRARGPGEVPLEIFEGRELTHHDFVGHDKCPGSVGVIVVGSGAGGAVAACNLQAQGHDVLIIEAGPHYPSPKITHEERRMTARLFVDGGIQTSRDNDFVVFQAQCVGGGTVINNGIALRVDQPGMIHPSAPDVLEKWASIGAAVDKSRFDAAYDAVEKALEIERIDPKSGVNNGAHLLAGWHAYANETNDPVNDAAPALWFRKNYGPRRIEADCAYCGYCNTGCPYGRKNGMAQSYLIKAREKGARILADARVLNILWRADLTDGKRVAEGVDVEFPDGQRRTILTTQGVVVAAGTMASSRLLMASGIVGAGDCISLNIASPVAALMPEDRVVRAWDEDQMATYVDRGDFLLESHFQPPMSMASLLTGWFSEHARRMQNYSRLVSSGILFPADRRGRLIGGKLHFKLDAEIDLPLIRRAIATLARVHLAGGAIEVYPALARGGVIYPGTDIEAFLEEGIREADDVVLSSSHPHGGNARNVDPDCGVVDLECRVHGTTNVMVTDASVFPSCIRVNAQLTTMAMAHYVTVGGGVFGPNI
ncbi:GMC family oxidoreductase N-terminal domain-containing protein [Sphingomonas sp.]|uniref:GMC family oxidoreductase N-terminal domain-containing protein n=1 Tax=Sphingomonas sp. TaxID=28214 RepID=UPI0025F5FABA|nr:GMC family oxidoreductase [Sphingomonas sp.]